MGHSPPRTRGLLAPVRAYFGLTQQALAGYLGVPLTAYANIEAGRRALAAPQTLRLLPLLRLLPPAPAPVPGPHGPPPEPLPEPPPPGPPLAGAPVLAAGPLVRRLAYCRHHAARLQRQADAYAQQARYAARRAAALPALRAALPTPTDPTAVPHAAAAATWLATLPPALPPAARSAWHLLRVRAAALTHEAEALAALLPPADGG